MLILNVLGLPSIEEKDLMELKTNLKFAPTLIKELGIREDQVCILFPESKVYQGLGEEIIVMVDGSSLTPPRIDVTDELIPTSTIIADIRNKLAEYIATTIKNFAFVHVKNNQIIHTIIQTFDITNGYHRIHTKE